MPKTWFTMQARGTSAEVFVLDELGSFGITAADFSRELRALGTPGEITVHVNSPGGDPFVGLAIYNMLSSHKAKITVRVQGLAASAASLIVMAGNPVIMPKNALLMLHNPSGLSLGDAEDMRQLADMLDKVRDSLVAVYAAKSGKSEEELVAILDAETWFSAEEAIAAGFADELAEEVKVAASFDLSHFKNAPPAGKKPETAASAPGAATAEQIIAMCNDAGAPYMVSPLLRNALSAEEVETRIGEAKAFVAQARRCTKDWPAVTAELAEKLLTDGMPVVRAKGALLDIMFANQTPDFLNAHMPGTGADVMRGPGGDYGWSQAYARTQGKAPGPDHGWDDAAAKVFGPRPDGESA